MISKEDGKMEKCIVSGDLGRLALMEDTLTDYSKVYNIWIRGLKIPCVDREKGLIAFNKLREIFESGLVL